MGDRDLVSVDGHELRAPTPNDRQPALAQADTVTQWRAGLAGACDGYRQWAAGPRDDNPPNVVGAAWFEGLRPHLPTTGEAATYRTAHEISCDNLTVALLSLEIGRVEKQWMDEAKSYPRRARN